MTELVRTGITLILAGLALVFIGVVLSSGNAEFGGLIMIGPVPIIFGTSPEVTIAAMVLGVLLLLAYFISGRRNA